jgi:hypothetical protein
MVFEHFTPSGGGFSVGSERVVTKLSPNFRFIFSVTSRFHLKFYHQGAKFTKLLATDSF